MQPNLAHPQRIPTALALLGLVIVCLLPGAGQAATVVKNIYVNDADVLSRTQSTSTTASATISANSANSVTWTLAARPATVSLAAGNITVNLYITRVGGNPNRSATVQLLRNGGVVAAATNVAFTASTTPTLATFTLTGMAAVSLLTTDSLALRVFNTTTTNGRDFTVSPSNGTAFSTIGLNVNDPLTVATTLYDAAAPGGATITGVVAPGTVYIRSVVTDVFGAADIITVPTLTITHASQTGLPTAVNMTEYVPAATASSETYEYAYATDTGQSGGTYTATVTGYEGVEGTVTAAGAAAYTLFFPVLTVTKASNVVSDPFNVSNPKRIPGATLQYSLTVTNGSGATLAEDVVVTDVLPSTVTFLSGSLAVSVDASCTTAGDNTTKTDANDGEASPQANYNAGTRTVTFGDTSNDIAASASVTFCYRVTVN